MNDKHKTQRTPNIDQKLVEEGSAQLSSEIEILESWLADLGSADASDPYVIDAKNSYLDMLRSRRAMLNTPQAPFTQK